MPASRLSTAAATAALIVVCHSGIAGAQTLGVSLSPDGGSMYVHNWPAPWSRAAAIGLAAGDHILSINGVATYDHRSMRRAMRNVYYHDYSLRIVISRGGHWQVLDEDNAIIPYAYSAHSGSRHHRTSRAHPSVRRR